MPKFYLFKQNKIYERSSYEMNKAAMLLIADLFIAELSFMIDELLIHLKK